MANIDNTEDMINVSDIIERIEELESEREDFDHNEIVEDDVTALERWEDENPDYNCLIDLMEEMKGYGGDEQWRGDWYPAYLIRETYFTEYAEDLVKDIADLPRDIPNYIVIDWEATAENLKADYTAIEYGNVTYLYR